jgi:hypothetical protein
LAISVVILKAVYLVPFFITTAFPFTHPSSFLSSLYNTPSLLFKMVLPKLNIPAVIISFLLAVPALTAPTAEVDGGRSFAVENIVPREYIDEVLAYYEAQAQAKKRDEWKRAKRALHTLQKRLPADQGCDDPSHWVARNCLSDQNPRAYEDECQPPNGEDYEVDGLCPENTVCLGITEPNGRDPNTGEELIIDDIICAPGTPPAVDNISGGRQFGFRQLGQSSGTQDVAIPVNQNNGSASVSAAIVSEYYLAVHVSISNILKAATGILSSNLKVL